ncbi:MAG: ribonuclease J, partial [Pseudomonadota bacterium]
EDDLPLHVLDMGARLQIGPFDVELISMSHSIPEPAALAIRTPLGIVLHTGDWKLDETPLTSAPTDENRLREIGREGLDALICDSTNAIREGVSPSEGDVAENLSKLIRQAPNCVAVTTFASNVARLGSVAKAARAAGRELIVVGRAMYRVIEAAQATGYLDPELRFHQETAFKQFPSNKVVALCTGSQGEPRAAMARIASGEHPHVSLKQGDWVIFSSRTIPGNEKAVGRVQNALSDNGIEILTDQDALVHVSGHPRRGELEKLYAWLKPDIAVPMHGEGRHLEAHAELAEDLGVGQVIRARNGTMVKLLPKPAAIVDDVPVGRLYRDGYLLTAADEGQVRDRRKLSFAGIAAVSLVLTTRGELVADPEIALKGLPEEDTDGVPLAEIAREAAIGTVESIPRPRRKDPKLVSEAVRRGVRAAIAQAWGKKPICTVLTTVL